MPTWDVSSDKRPPPPTWHGERANSAPLGPYSRTMPREGEGEGEGVGEGVGEGEGEGEQEGEGALLAPRVSPSAHAPSSIVEKHPNVKIHKTSLHPTPSS